MPHSSDSLRAQLSLNPAIVSGIGKPQEPSTRPEGVDLEALPIGAVLEIHTAHSSYRLENMGNGNAMLSGHPKYCPQPAPVLIHGSLGADGQLRWRFLGTGLRMVFLPLDRGIVRTSPITAILASQSRPVV